MPLFSWVGLALMGAIAAEIAGTIALKASDGFTRPGPALVVVIGYGIAFYLLSVTLRTLPLGFTYAIWSGIGIAGTAIAGALLFGEGFGATKLAGMALIVAGVLLLNVKPG